MKRLSLVMFLVTLGVLILSSAQAAAANEQFSLRGFGLIPHPRWTPGCIKGYCDPGGPLIPFQMTIRNAIPGKTYRADIWFDFRTTKKNLLGIVAFTDASGVDLAGTTVPITGGTATWATSYVGPEKYQNVWGKRLAVTIVADDTEVVLPWWAKIGNCAQAAQWSGATLDVRFVWTGLRAEDIIPPGERTVPIMINPAIPTYFISGYKWHDLDGDGIWDLGEPPLADWTINLYDGLGWLGSDVTDGNGYYEFPNLLAGTYTVCEQLQLQEGWTQTFPVSPNCHTATLGPDATNLNFGNFQWLHVRGCKFDDLNGDGTRQAGEPGIAGWGIALSGAASASTTTNASGNYSFLITKGGQYTVTEEDRAGWVHTNASSHTFTVVSGQDVQLPCFGNFKCFAVDGYKFYDANGNGTWDPGEVTVPGWPIALWRNGVLVTSTVTDASGHYLFGPICDGANYEVREGDVVDWVHTTPTSFAFTGVSGVNRTYNFGNYCIISQALMHTKGFWQNQGCSIITAADRAYVNGLTPYTSGSVSTSGQDNCGRVACPGTTVLPFDNNNEIGCYIVAPNSQAGYPNIGLAQQLLAFILNCRHWVPSMGSTIVTPWGPMTAQAIINAALAGWNSGDPGQVSLWQSRLTQLNEAGYVNLISPIPCPR